MSFNRVTLIGRLGADPEVHYTQGGSVVANFRVATSEHWTDKKSGERQERTEWRRITVWGRQAETCGEYLRKGSQACVEGRIQTREWEDRAGNKRYTTEIVANRIVFIDGSRASEGGRGDRRGVAEGARRSEEGWGGYSAPEASPPPLDDSDIPF